jgi:uncharacterized protein
MGSLKDDLLDPGAYPAPGPQRIELAETHISWVFLAGDDVYKVKKPVDFGFLDFRTLPLRRAACEAELRLNARLAPGTYLGLVPVRRDAAGRHRIGGGEDEGEIAEWAVHMRRLSDDVRADVRLGRGALSGEAVDAVAVRLAAFHASARCDEETARYGRPEAIGRSVEENFAATRPVIARFLRPEDAAEIEGSELGFLREHGALFERRIAEGRVRDGHGDLRLEHVYLGAGGDLRIIDCIEFNDRFRYGDVCADLAFLSMDLAFHGRVDLAERLLARYAREANDFDLYALVDFYEGYRAYVRGKVATLLAADEGADEPLRLRAAAEARRYFLLALSADRRSLLSPSVVAVGGIIASGKSTVAAALGAAMGAPVVDADRTRKHFLGVGATVPVHEEPWRGGYDPAVTEKVYAEVLRRAAVVLASGRPVVVDASFRSGAMRAAARALAGAHGVPFRLVECRAAADVCRARLAERERREGVSDGRLAIFDDFCSRFEPVTELGTDERFVVDTTGSPEESLAAAKAHLDTWPEGLVG